MNTVPLVWGMLHGNERGIFDLSFSVPSQCADRVASGEADLGILPVAEIQRLGLPYFREVGIACRGPVRSILLISKVKPQEIRTLATDSSSRTSVMLARVLLERKYGSRPAIRTMGPDLSKMLDAADAALIIGDPALRIDPNSLPYEVLDLGKEWTELTDSTMIFALWSGPQPFLTESNRRVFSNSCRFGLRHLENIVATTSASMGLPQDLVRSYLADNLILELTDDDLRGLDLFLSYVAALR